MDDQSDDVEMLEKVVSTLKEIRGMLEQSGQMTESMKRFIEEGLAVAARVGVV